MLRICTLRNNITNIRQKRTMNTEQQEYISLINRSAPDDILIKKTGWEEINLQGHAHKKFQIIYTLSGTLHVETEGANYFVPEKHIAWIPENASHKLSSNSRQVSLIIFYVTLNVTPVDSKSRFSIYSTNAIIAENMKFIASKGKLITQKEQPDLYNFTLSFFNLLPQMSPGADVTAENTCYPQRLPTTSYTGLHHGTHPRRAEYGTDCVTIQSVRTQSEPVVSYFRASFQQLRESPANYTGHRTADRRRIYGTGNRL